MGTHGISGVDLRGLPKARWDASLYLFDPMGAHGQVIVEGADDRTIPGVKDGVTWQLE
jgi:hypothetical protein